MKQRCSSSACGSPVINETTNYAAAGSVQQGAANEYNATSCVDACIASPTCLACDWTQATGSCNFSSTQNPLLFSLKGTDHYDLYYPPNNCITTGILYDI